MDCIHNLESELRQRSVGPSRSVLSAVNPQLVLSAVPLCSALSQPPEPGSLPTNSTVGLNKIKGKVPSVYKAGEDIRLWFLELNNYFDLCRYSDPELQAKCAATYLSDTIYHRIK